jgi:hypothetical protein
MQTRQLRGQLVDVHVDAVERRLEPRRVEPGWRRDLTGDLRSLRKDAA